MMEACKGCRELFISEAAGGAMRHGKCIDCWCIDAVCLRTQVAVTAGIVQASKNPKLAVLLEILNGAIKPLNAKQYLHARDMEVDEDGCGVIR